MIESLLGGLSGNIKQIKMEKEIRSFTSELRKADDSRTVEGYALLFNKESQNLGGFTEVIERDALNSSVIENSDILCYLNHNEDRGVLARSKKGVGSLHLEIDDTGLKYRFEAPNTALGDELLENLKRGDITESSFAFTISKDVWEKRSNNVPLRRIKGIRELYDVSPVYKPAYQGTTVNCRSYDEFKLQEVEEELEIYFNTLKSQLND